MVDISGKLVTKDYGILRPECLDPAALIKLSTELKKNETLEAIRCVLRF